MCELNGSRRRLRLWQKDALLRETQTLGLNIKSEEADRLVRELAMITGRSMTAAVTQADRLLAISGDCAAHLKEPFRSADHGDLLYDERGPPR